jgi:hypothetical protein
MSRLGFAVLAILLATPAVAELPKYPGLSNVEQVQSAPSVEILRLDVGDLADRDTRLVGDKRRFATVMICAEENTVRIRRAEARLDNGRWQRLFVPLALKAGECSKAIEILNGPRKLTAVQFDYEALSAGYDRATVVVKGQPEVPK